MNAESICKGDVVFSMPLKSLYVELVKELATSSAEKAKIPVILMLRQKINDIRILPRISPKKTKGIKLELTLLFFGNFIDSN